MAWIKQDTSAGLTIDSAIPPTYEAFATLTDPESQDSNNDASDDYIAGVLEQLASANSGQSWWLGYLSKGGNEIVFPAAPKVSLYSGWDYVIVEAGPPQAATWRRDDFTGNRKLPDLMFPADRSWLLSTLWDDTWTCLGGPAALIEALLNDSRVDARRVPLGVDATPPGHQAR